VIHDSKVDESPPSLADVTAPAAASRVRLPETRSSLTHKFSIEGHEGYLTVGLYEDGRPGEVFIKMAKQGSTVRGLMDAIGVLTSLALQYGVPVETLAEKFEFARFEPAGWTKNPDIGYARSVVDYVFRWLGRVFSDEYHATRPPLKSLTDDVTKFPNLSNSAAETNS
jgi:ribonucleoside-diphosphate reductase alpha chain